MKKIFHINTVLLNFLLIESWKSCIVEEMLYSNTAFFVTLGNSFFALGIWMVS